ncbi:something about silencing, SAS, complex subunit 4-domain-containing protein [Apodospora peruviana]|uniref:Something about silencing, SAS, complex subunit 4-domain-containing protein n=1 Tax=Apodospora peruviana TaxID=516989 RepID=A0AAE0IQX2_9PEZI|nr:something about silencing, SAS, complex subunit 4-domain-containing protein [Apodospora peruviana]
MAMTASMTRSRRAEGLRHPHPHPHPIAHHPQLIATAKAAQQALAFAPNSNRKKRQFETSTTHDIDPIVSKKPRFTTGIAVEIPARPASFHSRGARDSFDAKSQPPPPPSPAKPKPAHTGPKPPDPSRAAPTTTAPKTAPPVTKQQSGLTEHQRKVANGLKHELNRLQPAVVPDIKEQGRKLRSQEATRFKSDLSAYFPDYDEVIGNDPKEQHILNLDTPIIITTGSIAPADLKPSVSLDKQSDPQPPHSHDAYGIRSYGDALFTDLWDSQKIDFSFFESQSKGNSLKDPLPDSFFEPAHKKAERLERSIRNSEKGRAQHEKDQIIRLLDGLQGPDWLRVMGVSGITETKKKTFEPARAHFIKGCAAILEKFRRWATEEKRRKLEKEQALAKAEAEREAKEQAEEEEDEEEDVEESVEEDEDVEKEPEEGEEEEEEEGDQEEEVEEDPTEEKVIPDSDEDMADDDEKANDSDGDPPDYSDVDASIAKQLREELMAAAAKKAPLRRGKRAVASSPRPTSQPEPYREFKSFFKKKYERDAALSKSRRRGRTVKAWGEPLPDVKESEFSLPDEFLDEDTLKIRARRRRREKRQKH